MIISTGNEELDMRIGGIPFPCLMLIEGGHGTGKTIISSQFSYGLLLNGKKGLIITTEQLTYDYIKKTKEVKINLVKHFLSGYLKIYPLNVSRFKWAKQISNMLLNVISSIIAKGFDFVVIDSFSVIASFTDDEKILDFLKDARTQVKKGKAIIITVHPNVFPEGISTKIRSIVDVYYKLSATSIGGRRVKVMERVKTIGAISGGETISFDVDPDLGVKIVPLSLSRA